MQTTVELPHQRTTLFLLMIVVCTTFIGFVPVVLFWGRPFWSLEILLLVGAVALSQFGKLHSRTPRPLTGLEILAGGIGSFFQSAASALFLLLLYGLQALVLYLLFRLGFRWFENSRLDLYITTVLGLLMVFGSADLVGDRLRDKFFPETGVGNTPLFPGLTWGKFLRRGAIAILVFIGICVLARYDLKLGCVAFELFLMTISSGFHDRLEPEKTLKRARLAVDAVKKLLEAGGYKILDRLQTGVSELDRLIATFDLVAYLDGHALAIQFKTSGAAGLPSVAWTEATSIRTAIWAIYKGAEKFHIDLQSAQPMLVFAGCQPDEHLVSFAMQESIRIVKLNDDSFLENVVSSRFSADQLRGFAGSVLGLRPHSVEPPSPLAEHTGEALP